MKSVRLPSPRSRAILPLALSVAGSLLTTQALVAQAPTVQDLLERIEAQDQRIAAFESRQGAAEVGDAGRHNGWSVDNKGGFRIFADDGPFELRINGRMQFRYAGFDPDTNSATPTPDRNDFEIERGRLEFSGTFFDENTHFYINLDADTDDNHAVIFHDFWVNYDFAENHSLYVGKAFFPGSRDWINGSTSTHLVDRSLATTFFRPDRTLGVWSIGKICGDINYRVMVGNGLNTTDLEQNQMDTNFAYAASLWKDIGAPYGKGYADIQPHEDLAARIGTTFSFTEQSDGQGIAAEEARSLRLSDGTRITDMGVDSFDFKMLAGDAAVKYQGFSANCEMFYRWIDQIVAPGMPNIRRSYYDWGGYCDVGFMIVPERLEVVARTSTIQGALGDSWEYAGGMNYYVAGTHKNKLSWDLSKLDGSPTSNSGPDYRVGDDGWLFRLQWQIAF